MVLPIGIDLLNWAASLQIDFPNDNIPIIYDPNEWKVWGDYLVNCTSFSEAGAPGTNEYEDWNTWAQAVYYTINDNT